MDSTAEGVKFESFCIFPFCVFSFSTVPAVLSPLGSVALISPVISPVLPSLCTASDQAIFCVFIDSRTLLTTARTALMRE